MIDFKFGYERIVNELLLIAKESPDRYTSQRLVELAELVERYNVVAK